jgi:hypothetical protein
MRSVPRRDFHGAAPRALQFERVWRRPEPKDLRATLARLAEALLAPRAAADELDDARELLAYWEQRARRLPRRALRRRREAREMARRWRERIRIAEQQRYGPGLVGAASLLAAERRIPTTLAHRGRQAVRVAAYAAATAALMLFLVAAATIAVVIQAVAGAI